MLTIVTFHNLINIDRQWPILMGSIVISRICCQQRQSSQMLFAIIYSVQIMYYLIKSTLSAISPLNTKT